MLISLGLWKSSAKPVETDKDGIYPISSTELAEVRRGRGFNIGRLFAKKHEE